MVWFDILVHALIARGAIPFVVEAVPTIHGFAPDTLKVPCVMSNAIDGYCHFYVTSLAIEVDGVGFSDDSINFEMVTVIFT